LPLPRRSRRPSPPRELLARRAAAFVALEGRAALPEEAELIERILECEARCQAQARRRMDGIRRQLGEVRKGRRLGKAYARGAGAT